MKVCALNGPTDPPVFLLARFSMQFIDSIRDKNWKSQWD